MTEIKFYKEIEEEKLEFAVIICRMDNKWLLCKHKNRNIYEFPGGKREPGENISETAKREFFEETGASKFELFPITIYSMFDAQIGAEKFGMLYYGNVFEIQQLPEMEMEEICLFEELPRELRYPQIYRELIEKISSVENLFNNPTQYLNEIKNKIIIPRERQVRHTKKSIAVIFLTRYCSAECGFCIYKSKDKKDNCEKMENEFTREGCEKCIEFINSANIGYLLIAGGGEPFEKEEYIYELIEKSKAERIVIATNAFWGKDYINAQKIINRIQTILNNKENKVELVLRISIDRWHLRAIKEESISNIVNIFRKEIKNADNFKLEFHTILRDNTLAELAQKWNASIVIQETQKCISDNNIVSKNSKKRGVLEFEEGYSIKIGFAKLFYPNLLVNINSNNEINKKASDTFYEDILNNQEGNLSTVDIDGNSYGLDILINFNGNTSTWGNYQLENIPNIYRNDYSEIMDKLYNDIISYSYINMPLEERENIVRECNEVAVKRSALINVRDYSGAYLLYEDKTALYYAIRIIQKYIAEGKINQENLNGFSTELKNYINLTKDLLLELHNKANYSIIEQMIHNNITSLEEWGDTFFLIEKGHFCVDDISMKKGLEFCNKNSGRNLTVDDIINYNIKDRYDRLIERMTYLPKNDV